MAFRANKWGWKATAARLLLAPVVAAGLAVPAVGQTGPGGPATAPKTTAQQPVVVRPGSMSQTAPPSGKPAAAAPAKPGTKPVASAKPIDPKEMLKKGREAFEAGRYEEARVLARQAEANNATGRWGLFGDTPEALEKDIRAAKMKSDKVAAETLTKQAKAVYGQVAQAKTDADKLTLLNQAFDLADRAAALAAQGGGDFFDDILSIAKDDPAKLKKDIDAARVPLRGKVSAAAMAKKGTTPAATALATAAAKTAQPVSAGRTMTTPSVGAKPGESIQMASHTAPTATTPAAAKDPKAQAAALVADGRKLMKQGQLVEAKAKATEAVRLNAKFTATEDSPDALTRDVLAEAKKHIDVLAIETQTNLKKKDWKKADAALTAARTMAAGMGFPTRTLDEQQAGVRKAMGLPVPTYPAPTAVATAAPAASKPSDLPKPAIPTPVDVAAKPSAPADVAVKTVTPVIPTPVVPTIPEVAAKPATPDAAPAKDPVMVAAVIPPIGLPLPPTPIVPAAGSTTPAPAVVPTLPNNPTGPMVPTMPVVNPNPTQVVAAPALPVPVTPTPVVVPAPAAPAGMPPLPDPLAIAPVPSATPAVPAQTPVAVAPAPAMAVPVVPTPAPVAVAPTGPTGKQLLAQAEDELRRGELEMATKIATQAHNGDFGVKEDAQALLRMIDAEKGDRKRKDATLAFKNAMEAANAKQYDEALGVVRVLDPDSLPPDQKRRLPELTATWTAEAAKQKAPSAPVTETVVAAKPAGGLADQVKALGEVEFQKFRAEALETETKARAAFDRGETDLAIQMLTDFTAKVKNSTLSPGKQNMLLGPIGRRMDTFALLKRQMDFYTKDAADKKYAKEQIQGRSVAEQQKKEELQKKMREVSQLVKDHKYREAEGLALQLKSLDPDDPAAATMYELAKRHRRVEEAQKKKSETESFVLDSLNAAEREGPFVDLNNPVAVNVERSLLAMRRGGEGSELYARTRTVAEREIELKLDRRYSFEFANKPLRAVIDEIRSKADVNITTDDAAIGDEQISLDQTTVSETVKELSLRNVLTILLDKARLKYVVENDTIRVTTDKKAKGRLYTKVFSVMELVTPVPDFALADHQNINKVLQKASNPIPPWASMTPGGASAPARGGLNGGELVSGGGPGLAGPGGFQPGGNAFDTSGERVMVGSGGAALQSRPQMAAQLQKLVTGMVRPYSWQDMGGPGKLDYYDIGGALVVNQTADVIREVQDLLDALRRLQDLSLTVEVRLISLSESFFERVGVDFAMNVKTNASGRDGTFFERGLTTGQFAQAPYLNSLNGVNNTTVGWNPTTGGFTPDLNVPIRPSSYGLSIPSFGGYNGPTNSGGLALGLAFLNDIQVYMFLEAAQGDRRVNVMQAPKITLFNGQTSTVSVNDSAFFTTGLQVFNVGGQFVYLPQNTPAPTSGVNLTVQGVVTADRKFVRLTLAPILNELANATIPLFPVTAFITPVFEGGSQGVPIPFTQFFQQPSFTTISVQTTVQVPDGGTVVLGGLKRLSEGRNEFGPPVISSIPYLNRLFRNQGIGRETTHLMIMVTPRIVINAEEELIQTGQGGSVLPAPNGFPPGPVN